MTQFSITTLFSDFESGDLSREELEELIKEAVKKNYSGQIKEIKYLEDGVEVTLDNNEIIEIEIDWNEIILK